MDELAQYCLSRKGAQEDYPFGPRPLVIKVGGKMFALLSTEADGVHISLKCEPDMADLLRRQYATVLPGYHLNKRHWNTVIVDGSVPDEELKWMIDHSYAMVVKGLTRTEREKLGFTSEQSKRNSHRQNYPVW
ncbi:MmcQ/YjbR family DNA-binding protein [Paenibacillus thermotolerans]|uniref:MmcQ/YjbR family DNA-binding protein n=1 Tax=Paenibacillus thermotolerans TaxID=3027807 RepID=UPI00236885FA|nr:MULTISPECIES: MmcQ/YjbR family DNA-binding protein [unclassified Paenibacillus]